MRTSSLLVSTVAIKDLVRLRVTHIFSHIMVTLDICHDLLLRGSYGMFKCRDAERRLGGTFVGPMTDGSGTIV